MRFAYLATLLVVAGIQPVAAQQPSGSDAGFLCAVISPSRPTPNHAAPSINAEIIDRLALYGCRRGDTLIVHQHFNEAILAAQFCDLRHSVVTYREPNMGMTFTCVYAGPGREVRSTQGRTLPIR
jgi:hypothetical protein